VFDFGDIWEGALTRARAGAEYPRVYPGGTLQSNFNLMYRVAARLKDPESEAVAERYAAFGHSNLEEYWTLLWRDPQMPASRFDGIALSHHFDDMGVVYARTSWDANATAGAFKAGPPEGHRAARVFGTIPEWSLDSGHSHPDNGSFIIWAGGRYLTGDTGYAGLPHARDHNTMTVGTVGQGDDSDHDVWRRMQPADLDAIRVTSFDASARGLRVDADIAAAYPAAAALARFHRTFTFTPPGDFTIDDAIELREPRAVQWFLQADGRIDRDADAFVIPGAPSLRIEPRSSVSRAAVEPTVLMAPGEPGSITQGRPDQRGMHLVLEHAAGDRNRQFSVRLQVQ